MRILVYVQLAAAQPWSADGADIILNVPEGQTVSLPSTPGHFHKGGWTFTKLGNAGVDAGRRYDQYLYSTNAGPGGVLKACSKQLTVHVPLMWTSSWLGNYQGCYNKPGCPIDDATGLSLDYTYVGSGRAIPESMEMLTELVDELNLRTTDPKDGQPFLADTCIQLSATHPAFHAKGPFADYFQVDKYSFGDMVQDARFSGVTKHAVIGITHLAQSYGIAKGAANVGLPYINAYWYFYTKKTADGAWPKQEVYTTFSVRSTIGHLDAMIKTIPEGASVGVLTDLGALEFADHVDEQLAATGRSTGAKAVLPTFTSANPALVDPLIVQFLETMLKNKMRYIVAMLGAAESYAALACNVWRMKSERYFMAMGNNPTIYGPLYMSRTSCGPLLAEHPGIGTDVIENGGWFSMFANEAVNTPDEDLLVNIASGSPGRTDGISYNLDNGPWSDSLESVFSALEPTGDCFDDEDALSNSDIFRKLLQKADGERITCVEAAPFGQNKKQLYAQYYGEFCPMTACKWNSQMVGCRTSCACRLGDPGFLQDPSDGPTPCTSAADCPTDAPLCGFRDGANAFCTKSTLTVNTMDGLLPPGFDGPLCTTAAGISTRLGYLQQNGKYFRCEGKSCRPLAYGSPNTAQGFQGKYAAGWAFPPALGAGAGIDLPGFCRRAASGGCHGFVYASQFRLTMPSLADALYSHAMSFRCYEKRHGELTRLANFEYGDYFVTNELLSCLEEEVEFEGNNGHISFSEHRQPKAGHVGGSFDQEGYLGTDPATGMASALTPKGAPAIPVGVITDKHAIMLKRWISITDWQRCKNYKGDMSPGRECPEGERVIWKDGDDPDLIPKAGPDSCPPGQYPRSIGEEATVDDTGLYKGGIKPWSWDRCVPCPAGTYKDTAGSHLCSPCPAGFAASAEGLLTCTACPQMTFAETPAAAKTLRIEYGFDLGGIDLEKQAFGSAQCLPCPEGQYALVGSTECATCPAGFSLPEGQTECKVCPLGSYEENRVCQACPERTTTFFAGGIGVQSCVCDEGFVWNRRANACETCPPESFCAGATSLPLAFTGFWAEHVGDVSEETIAAQNAALASGTYTKDAAAYSHTKVYRCTNGVMCPGDTITIPSDFANEVTKSNVRVGYPLEGACPQNSDPKTDPIGIACGRCQDGYYGRGTECSECSGGSTGAAIFLLLCIPFLMAGLYRGTTSTGTQRVQAAFILVSTCGMGAFFMQTIAVFSSFDIQWPIELKWLFDVSVIFMFDLNGISVACFHGPGFEGKYWATIILPLFVFVATALSFGLTRVLPVSELWKMQPNHTFSMVGMLMSALYITLVKVVIAFFECVNNPAADATLAKYRDVECGSDEHNSVTPAMAIGLIFYVIGFYMLVLHAAYTAPSKWMELSFRERWKFMLTRWRPDTYYWGTVVMTRNLLVAFAGIVSDQSRVQLVFVVVVVVCVFAITGSYQPWRAPVLNHFDVCSSIVLTLIGVFGVIFVSITREIQVAQQNDLPTKSQEDDQMGLAVVLSVAIAAFLVLFGSLVCWCLAMVLPSNMAKQADQHEKVCNELTAQLNEKLNSPTFKDEAERLIHESTAYDRNGLKNFLDKIKADGKADSTDSKAKQNAGVAQTISA